MIHTSNLMVSGGMVHSPLPGQSTGNGESSAPAGRPAARKSQIIEEEEDAEDLEEEIEEVDEFDGSEEDSGMVHSESNQPEDDTVKDSAEVTETGSPVSSCQPVLEPAPELESSPLRPPRSSSLRSRPPKATATIAAVTESDESTTQEDATANKTADLAGDAATKPATPSK